MSASPPAAWASGLLAPLDHAFARMLARRWPGADAAALALAALASAVAHEGHACLELDAVAPFVADEPALAALAGRDAAAVAAAAPFVGVPPAPGAALWRDGARLYLPRMHRAECRVAKALAALAAARVPLDDAAVKAAIAAALAGAERSAPAQRAAVAHAARHPLTVLLGGPGTGKTWTAARIVAAWRALGETGAVPPRIALTAPTGKAAVRLGEALGAGASDSVMTVHRLLGMAPGATRAHHDAAEPLPWGAVVVDEASMLDLETAAALFDALAPGTRLLLVGDPDQLPAVETIAPLAALAALAGAGGALGAAVLRLAAPQRFDADGALGGLLDALRRGDADAALALLRAGSGTLRWLPDGHGWEAFAAERYAALGAARSPAEALRALRGFRVLAAHREGPRGVAGANAAIARRAFGAGGAQAFPRCPLLIERNDPDLGLANGEVGVLWREGAGQELLFHRETADGTRALPLARLPPHRPALAMTVHKAQGSEFDQVLVLLPQHPSAVLTREWLYTAASRARRGLVVAGSEAVLRDAIARRSVRMHGLTERLAAATGTALAR